MLTDIERIDKPEKRNIPEGKAMAVVGKDVS